VTNDYQFRDNLNADVRSSLGEDEIEFAPYDSVQLVSILERRAAKALKDTFITDKGKLDSEVLESDVIPYCAALCAQDTGDARQAITLLFNACRRVDDRGDNVVKINDLDEAQEALERRAVERGISSLPSQPQFALLALTKVQLEDDTAADTETIRDEYETICMVLDADPLSRRRYREKLNDLASWNIIDKETRSRGRERGRTNYYELAVEVDSVLENIPDDRVGMEKVLKTLRGIQKHQ
jgi:cell division control protein 6